MTTCAIYTIRLNFVLLMIHFVFNIAHLYLSHHTVCMQDNTLSFKKSRHEQFYHLSGTSSKTSVYESMTANIFKQQRK